MQRFLRRSLFQNRQSVFKYNLQRAYFSTSVFKQTDEFKSRHIGPSDKDSQMMLKALGLNSMNELVRKTVPEDILSPLDGKNKPLSEKQALSHLRNLANENIVQTCYIGQGYYPSVTPSVILRNMLENPAWYTAYTPYQSEVSQGRMEMLLNFQTAVSSLTGLPVANCSLLDEASSCSEALNLAHSYNRLKKGKFIVSKNLFAQNISVLKTRAEGLGVEIMFVDEEEIRSGMDTKDVSGIIVQSPDRYGAMRDYSDVFAELEKKEKKLVKIMCSDLLSLVVAKSPGSMGADICVGSAQRFGVPMFCGGPHAGFMSVKENYTRLLPGRLIGVSKDADGKSALRMALQTREQFIKREKATSNICTAQALLANMAAAYAVYHGPDGLKSIAESVHLKAKLLKKVLLDSGDYVVKDSEVIFFDTIAVQPTQEDVDVVYQRLQNARIGVWKHSNGWLGVSISQNTEFEDLTALAQTLLNQEKHFFSHDVSDEVDLGLLQRVDTILDHEVFSQHHSETKMLRYLSKLEARDLTLRNSMIPLGSCTMKLNAASELIPVSMEGFKDIHPFAELNTKTGYTKMVDHLEELLARVTGFYAISHQPNSGATGEYAGLLAIRGYQKANGQGHRDICLIPKSAHGTNPASAVMAGLKVVGVNNLANGDVDIDDLKRKVEKHAANLSCLMITYPSTYGLFEEGVKEIISTIKDNGGLVYMDGANMNAQLGITSPGAIGADVCHLNLHKTFAIPHGGGGPGVGSIGVTKELAAYAPGHVHNLKQKDENQVSGAEWGSAGILPISYMFMLMLGDEGLLKSGQQAILSANYMASELSEMYEVLYMNRNGLCGHEFIIDLRYLSKYGLSESDVAKRLADYGFHAATMSWPVAGTMMIEPTESESKEECDRFVQAMKSIKIEIDEIVDGRVAVENSVLSNAPHSMSSVVDEALWNKTERAYTREQAVFPLPFVKENKFWPVARVDNAHGDRNLICTCPSVEEFEEEA
eukprot:snap_masked-scaffold_1-processed-gene-28.1-mRNA-1 protein AED:0.02 eAED:0.02 QI:0/0/0/1/1/1/2/0/987